MMPTATRARRRRATDPHAPASASRRWPLRINIDGINHIDIIRKTHSQNRTGGRPKAAAKASSSGVEGGPPSRMRTIDGSFRRRIFGGPVGVVPHNPEMEER